MYDHGARFYQPDTGRWFTLDALAEEYLSYSPYNYAMNSPIIYYDPDGNAVEMCCDELKGFIVGGIDNVFGTNLRQKVSVNNVQAFNDGLRAADATSVVVGSLMAVDGGKNMAAGTAIMAGSAEVTAASGGLAVEVSAPAAAIGGLTVVGGAVETGVGLNMVNNATSNMKNGNYRDEGTEAGDGSLSSSSSTSTAGGGRPRSTKHTDNRHINKKKYPNKSKYKNPAQRKKLENRTMKTEGTMQSDGRVRYDKDYGREIGTKGETSHRVIVDPKKKKIVTSFPQNKKN